MPGVTCPEAGQINSIYFNELPRDASERQFFCLAARCLLTNTQESFFLPKLPGLRTIADGG
jgi:hypothetical protein